jgi:hypothetical protein
MDTPSVRALCGKAREPDPESGAPHVAAVSHPRARRRGAKALANRA